jgi:hypothetical protein
MYSNKSGEPNRKRDERHSLAEEEPAHKTFRIEDCRDNEDDDVIQRKNYRILSQALSISQKFKSWFLL